MGILKKRVATQSLQEDLADAREALAKAETEMEKFDFASGEVMETARRRMLLKEAVDLCHERISALEWQLAEETYNALEARNREITSEISTLEKAIDAEKDKADQALRVILIPEVFEIPNIGAKHGIAVWAKSVQQLCDKLEVKRAECASFESRLRGERMARSKQRAEMVSKAGERLLNFRGSQADAALVKFRAWKILTLKFGDGIQNQSPTSTQYNFDLKNHPNAAASAIGDDGNLYVIMLDGSRPSGFISGTLQAGENESPCIPEELPQGLRQLWKYLKGIGATA